MNKPLLSIALVLINLPAFANFIISKNIYKEVPHSAQYTDSGSLIRNIDYKTVNDIVIQIEQKYKLKLETRGEAHITIMTPPEATGWFTDHKGVNFLISSKELHVKYYKTIQKTKFKVVCVGRKTNKKGHDVFYLVVDSKSKEILNIRSEIQKELELRANFTGMKTSFNAKAYYPHITIGFVKGDVHVGSKGIDTCIDGLSFKN